VVKEEHPKRRPAWTTGAMSAMATVEVFMSTQIL
jgi:hypothetical protein